MGAYPFPITPCVNCKAKDFPIVKAALAEAHQQLTYYREMTGKKTYKELDTEQQKGKRRFIERRVQENEAKKEINEYDPTDTRDNLRDTQVHEL